MKRIVSLICCLLSLNAMAKAPEIESRQASKQEIDSFDRFYLKGHPGQLGLGINFLITRTNPKKPWDIKARVLSDPMHGYKNLCKQDIANFAYDAAHGWRADGEHTINHMVWLDTGTACKVQSQVELETPMPDVDVIDLLRHGDAVLKQSSILLRGNTNCSLVYLQGLKFTGVGTATVGHEDMFQFRYLGEQFIPVTLSVRRLGTDFTTWDMHCSITEAQSDSVVPPKRSSIPLR